jgi:hypothetical protein
VGRGSDKLPPGEGKEGVTCARSGGPARQWRAPDGGGRCWAAWSRGGGVLVGWATTGPLQWAGPKNIKVFDLFKLT